MAAGAVPPLMVVGGIGGIVLIVVAWLRTVPAPVVAGLALVATLPFAVLGWTAVVPVLVGALAAGLTVLVYQEARHAR